MMPTPFRFLLGSIVVLLLLLGTRQAQAATLYKNYVVRYDRGWDILCDPYRVQSGDWVLKIFRQKGEIAHYDFREFLGIFQRLNPHIKDIDRIRPGQVVDIPLKKLAQGNLPGQSSGVVTIPFILLSTPEEKVTSHSRGYTIQKGDTVSILVAKQFGGRYGSDLYNQGLTLFKAINPHVKDINRIYAGQRIYLPDPSIREKSWYDALFDDEGNLARQLSEAADDSGTAGDEAPPLQTAAAPAMAPQPPAASAQAQTGLGAGSGPVADTATMMGGRLQDKGTLFLPKEGGNDFEIDLSRYPLIDLGHGEKVLLSKQDHVMGVDLPVVQSYWDQVKVVRVPETASSGEIAASILQTFSQTAPTDQLAFRDAGVTLNVRAQWIRSHASADGKDLRHTCITLIASADQRTHETIVRYLDQNGIAVQDLLPSADRPEPPPTAAKPRAPSAVQMDGTSPQRLVAAFAETMGYSYAPDTPISFPYAGVQVEAKSNLLSFGNGKQVLVDFGDLYGDAADAIRATGIDILRFGADSEPLGVIGQLLETADRAYTRSPSFLAANRPAAFTTAIGVNGILVPENRGQKRLFVETELPEPIELFLAEQEIQLVRIERPADE